MEGEKLPPGYRIQRLTYGKYLERATLDKNRHRERVARLTEDTEWDLICRLAWLDHESRRLRSRPKERYAALQEMATMFRTAWKEARQ